MQDRIIKFLMPFLNLVVLMDSNERIAKLQYITYNKGLYSSLMPKTPQKDHREWMIIWINPLLIKLI